MERIVPRSYVALEELHEDHHSTLVEVVGNIAKKYVSILIEPGSTHGYITPRLVEICAFKKLNHRKSWFI